ncbi:ATPase family AAA domain-containing protein 3C-like isoform X2 [Daktulosphaira vitifoliae]|uniref:ATPase family AAA domain-containing protein 3C-like isoform X2 n=1 Tax=Daktulosphaira vitifoliae TaxID=58002 RepID=UPI0021A99F21|nr:ATPase family AAA domain-containing protein 3C-like isoform X2 [Daktulosphaira vitifoliae]
MLAEIVKSSNAVEHKVQFVPLGHATTEKSDDNSVLKNTLFETAKFGVSFKDKIVEGWILKPREQAITLCCYLTAFVVGSYSLKKSTNIAKYIKKKWEIPKLVRETSCSSMYDTFRRPITKWMNNKKLYTQIKMLKDLRFPNEAESKYPNIVDATYIMKSSNDTFRNLMIWGPPGNGKKLLAKKLALNVDMNYALISGLDVASLGFDASFHVQRLFNWIEKRNKPTLLVVDEADEFLDSRNSDSKSYALKIATNNFLNKIIQPSRTLMVLLITKKITNIDSAIYSRISDIIEVPLPDIKFREAVLDYFITKHLPMDFNLSKNLCKEISVLTDTMTCQEIENLVLSWKIVLHKNRMECCQEEILKICKVAADTQIIKNAIIHRNKMSFATNVDTSNKVKTIEISKLENDNLKDKSSNLKKETTKQENISKKMQESQMKANGPKSILQSLFESNIHIVEVYLWIYH